jgi:homoserine dehydrogenase
MKQDQPLQIGLFGFGVVGEGIYKVLQQTPALNAVVKTICIKHPDKDRAADPALFTTSYEAILDDPEINIVVELIDDADEAYKIVTAALRKKKAVVSANKKLIAEHLAELLYLQKEEEVPFLYEAAVCGSIPIIRNLEEYYDNDLLQSICGIVNGSTNFILTKILEEGLTYAEALLEAQRLGFAESNPKLDVEGYDAANKLCILLAHAHGIIVTPDQLIREGITRLHPIDIAFAEEKGYQVKLTAQATQTGNGKVAAFVLPQFLKKDHLLAGVKYEYNGVILESKLADRQFLLGKGAGRYPTSSAVISDISALQYNYRYEYKKFHRREKLSLSRDFYLRIFVSFNDWTSINKWDFEQVTEFHSTADRQYLTGIIHVEKLRNAAWFQDPSVSLVVLPEGIIEKEAVISQSLKKVSLQLAGVN